MRLPAILPPTKSHLVVFLLLLLKGELLPQRREHGTYRPPYPYLFISYFQLRNYISVWPVYMISASKCISNHIWSLHKATNLLDSTQTTCYHPSHANFWPKLSWKQAVEKCGKSGISMLLYWSDRASKWHDGNLWKLRWSRKSTMDVSHTDSPKCMTNCSKPQTCSNSRMCPQPLQDSYKTCLKKWSSIIELLWVNLCSQVAFFCINPRNVGIQVHSGMRHWFPLRGSLTWLREVPSWFCWDFIET